MTTQTEIKKVLPKMETTKINNNQHRQSNKLLLFLYGVVKLF